MLNTKTLSTETSRVPEMSIIISHSLKKKTVVGLEKKGEGKMNPTRRG